MTTTLSATRGVSVAPEAVKKLSATVVSRALPGGAHGLVFNLAGRLFVADTYGSRRILGAEAPYQALQAVGTPSLGPAGLRATSGALFISELNSNQVLRRANDGATVTWSVPAPWNVAPMLNGEAWAVGHGGSVARLAPNGTSKMLFAGLQGPFDIVAADATSCWISEQHAKRVTRRDASGKILETVSVKLENPEGLCVDRHGNLWIADTGANTVFCYTADRSVLSIKLEDMPICLAEHPTRGVFANSAKGLLFEMGLAT